MISEIQMILPAVAAVIFDNNGNVLLQKRHVDGAWCIISGHVEFGETVEDAIIREIREEAGLDAEVVRLIGVYSLPESQTYVSDHRTVQYVTTCFEAQLLQPLEQAFPNEETEDLRYFSIHGLPEAMGKIHPQWLKDALASSEGPFIR